MRKAHRSPARALGTAALGALILTVATGMVAYAVTWQPATPDPLPRIAAPAPDDQPAADTYSLDGLELALERAEAVDAWNAAVWNAELERQTAEAVPVPAQLPEPAPVSTAAPSPPATTPAAPAEPSDEIADLIRSVFGPHGDAAVRIADCESSFQPGATNGVHVGLFQLSGTWHQDRAAHLGYSWDQMWEAYPNIVVAFDLFSEQGWGPWECKP